VQLQEFLDPFGILQDLYFRAVTMQTPGSRFRAALELERPLQIAGTINAYCALQARLAGFQAIYLSGAGVANAAFALPDLGMTSMTEVAEEVRRITENCDLPLLVDIDTGWGSALSIERTVRELTRAGAAALHLEDQISEKRCGHRPGKVLVSTSEMCDRVSAAVQARTDSSLVIMARTDAIAVESLEQAIGRAQAYVEAGAEMVFAEAMRSEEQMRQFTSQVAVPVLANMTEFGQTPLMSTQRLRDCGIRMALYPLSAFRAMSLASQKVYQTIRIQGTQEAMLSEMQTRQSLYDTLDYWEIEKRIDRLVGKEKQASTESEHE
jgi:methylisocitrate lyase